jgi:predicted GH43/DUF377 family glycosyl hydrolase
MKDKNLFTLRRHPSNPFLTPRPENRWEGIATFNPAGVLLDDFFHLYYRAVDTRAISSIGYATITHDMETVERPDHPIMTPDQRWEELGCEDPRITRIGDFYYVLYTAYSRRGPRIALAKSLDLKQFAKIGLIGPDLPDKDTALFPETINGKLAMIHRIEPSMRIAYFDSHQFEKLCEPSIRSQYWTDYLHKLDAYTLMEPEEPWEEKKIGVGPPPIRTSAGWLIIYHAVDNDHVYRAGAALVDLDHPQKVIARSRTPILEPKEPYETNGFVPHVVFPEAAMILNSILYVFYGAADTVCCLATSPLEELVQWLVKQR